MKRRILFRRAGVWALDYAGATRRQALSLTSRSRPDRWSARKDAVHVVLVPGVWEPWRYLEPLGRTLHRAGFGVLAVPQLGYNRRPVADGAAHVRRAIESLTGTVVIVGHSKGGLVGKRVLLDWKRDRLAGKVPEDLHLAGLVAIATPFGGSVRARLIPWPSIAELRDDAPSLAELATETAVHDRIVEIVPAWDPHVPSHRPLVGGRVVRLRTEGHFRSLDARETRDAVVAAVNELAERANAV